MGKIWFVNASLCAQLQSVFMNFDRPLLLKYSANFCFCLSTICWMCLCRYQLYQPTVPTVPTLLTGCTQKDHLDVIFLNPEKQSLLMLLAGMDMDRDFPFACHEKGRLPSFIPIYRTQLKVDTYSSHQPKCIFNSNGVSR